MSYHCGYHETRMDASDCPVCAEEIAGLNLPPGYEVQSWAYGPAIVDRTTDRLVLVAARSGSKEWLEDAAWNDYADHIHDYIVERRVTVELVAGHLVEAAKTGDA